MRSLRLVKQHADSVLIDSVCCTTNNAMLCLHTHSSKAGHSRVLLQLHMCTSMHGSLASQPAAADMV
jgi:hypothetical protein